MDKFSLQSRRAIVTFAILLFIVVLIPRFYFYFKKPTTISLTETLSNLPEKERQQVGKKINKYHSNLRQVKSKFKVPPKKFDPNEYTLEDWMYLGLSEKQAQTILNFNKFGFRSEKDLQKCFVFQNEKFFNIIQDSLVFPTNKIGGKYDPAMSDRIAVDINKANKEDLKKLKGIGDFYADKIITYRERLGGFISINQLLEIYKFDQEKLASIKPYLLLSKSDVKQINLNTVDTKSLKNHPYVNDWNLANSIIKMRTQKGEYTSIEEIKESVLMTDSIYNKIVPYLKIK